MPPWDVSGERGALRVRYGRPAARAAKAVEEERLDVRARPLELEPREVLVVHPAVTEVQVTQRRAAALVQVADEPAVEAGDVGDAQSGQLVGEHPGHEPVGGAHRWLLHAVQRQTRQTLAQRFHPAQGHLRRPADVQRHELRAVLVQRAEGGVGQDGAVRERQRGEPRPVAVGAVPANDRVGGARPTVGEVHDSPERPRIAGDRVSPPAADGRDARDGGHRSQPVRLAPRVLRVLRGHLRDHLHDEHEDLGGQIGPVETRALHGPRLLSTRRGPLPLEPRGALGHGLLRQLQSIHRALTYPVAGAVAG